MKTKIFIIGDTHFPFHSKKALKKVLTAVQYEKPTHVVQIGDLYDQYGFSRYTKKNIQLPEKELKVARRAASGMWETITGIHKSVRCYQLFGNHDIRLIKRLAEKIPEAQEVLGESFKEFYYTFKGVTTVYDDREELNIAGITFMHGYRSKIGDHMRFNRSSTVVGHSHVGGVVYEQSRGETLFELNAGYLADEGSEPLKYRPQTSSRWTLGYGLITEGVNGWEPQFIPLEK